MHSPLDIQIENNNKDVYILQGNYMYDVMQDLVHYQIVFFSIKYPQDVHHFQLPGYPVWYHTKIRPGAVNFLKSISELYELHIFTMGSRMYAHTIARMLDPDRKLFAYRIRSRDECFNAFSKSHDMRLVHNNARTMQFCVLQSPYCCFQLFIRLLQNKETGAEVCPAIIVSWIITWDALVSYWPILFPCLQ